MPDYLRSQEAQANQFVSDSNTRLRDMEEKHRLLKDRTLLIGQNLIEEREKTFREIQELKKDTFILKEEMLRMKDFLQRVSEQLSHASRKEELLILQRQFDMLKLG